MAVGARCANTDSMKRSSREPSPAGGGSVSALAPIPRLDVGPIAANASLRTLTYDALKRAITEMDL